MTAPVVVDHGREGGDDARDEVRPSVSCNGLLGDARLAS
jgi:hypothetical protein